MRTIAAADEALYGPANLGGRATFLRVDVQDGGGTYRDMTTYLGQNFVISAQWGDSVDGESQNGQVVFKREVEMMSTAPLMTQSPANVGLVFAGSYVPLVYIARGIRIYTADMPDGQTPGASDWRFMFDGQIDKLNEAQGETMTVDVSDKIQAVLRDTFIEVERVYAFATGANALKGCRTWTPLTSINQNELVVPTDANKNGHFFKDTTAGSNSTGGTEPVWPTSSTVVDSGVTWTEEGATASMAIWSIGLAVNTGDRIAPTALNANGHFYIAQGPGQTGGSEPVWPTGAGSTVSDNGIVWKESGAIATAVETIMAQIAADNGQSVTVNIPGGSPNWLIKMFIQQRQAIWDALRTLVDQIGWDLRPQWDSGSNTFKLNLWTPNRAKVSPDRTFGPADKYDVQSLEIDISKVRNVVEVIFSASGSLDPSGNPLRIPVIVSDSTSITKYGRRYMLLGEASTSTVDTSTEATAMANAALSDLKEPNAEKQVLLPYFPFTELGDLYRFSNDAVYSDTNLDLAVVGYQHTVDSEGQASTQVTCRGKPSTGCDRWLGKDARSNSDDVHATNLADSDQPKLTTAAVVGGTLLTLAASSNKRGHGQDYEWHIGTSAGFTPTISTLLQSQGGNQVTAPHLIPGNTYYAKLVPIRRNASRVVRGQPSAAYSFVAGQASAGHLIDGVSWGDPPLNGGFETQVDGSATGMPDHWAVYAGALGTDLSIKTDANGLSGGRYMEIDTHTGGITSAIFPIVQEANEANRFAQMYRVHWWRKAGASNSAGAVYNFLIRLLDASGAEVDNLTAFTAMVADDKKGHWVHEEGFITLHQGDPTARQAQLRILATTGATFVLGIDEIRVQHVGTDWYPIGSTTKFTDNYESVPGFANSWVNYNSSTHQTAAFRKDSKGRVYVKGMIRSGTIAAAAFTLPKGFRPPLNANFAGTDGLNAFCRIEVASTGTVTPLNGNNGYVSLDGISFETFGEGL